MSRNGVRDTFFGRAGEMAVMAELLLRGWNVAVPEIDIGDDVFVVRDSNGEFKRVQVKSANSKQQNKSIIFQISISSKRLTTPVTPELTLVFPVRSKEDERWKFFCVINRSTLNTLFVNDNVGNKNSKGDVNFRFKYETDIKKLTIGTADLSKHINDWASFPIIEH